MLLRFVLLAGLMISCGDDSDDDPAPATPAEDTASNETGAQLYTANCSNSSCHGDLENSTKKGRTAEQITNAIASVSAMQQVAALQALTAEQIEKIAEALAE